MGCSFFERNYERDYQQVVAVVKSYDIKNEVRTEDTDSTTGETITKTEDKIYTTKKRTIYKRDLIEYISNNQSSLAQSYPDAEDLVNKALEMLIDTELIVNEVDALIDAGLIKWGQAQDNTLKQRIYQVIDGSIISIQNELLESRDNPTIDTDLDALDESTTYPVKPSEEVDDGDEIEPEPWEPSLSSYPGLFGDSDERSLGKQAMREFITLLKDRVKDDFRVTDADRKKFEEDDEKINEVIDTKGISYVYEMIGDTHYMYYVSGKSIERSVKITELQNYLTDSITVSENEVVSRYNQLLRTQKSLYDADVSSFESALSGSDPVLYYPNNDYFYVKHILLSFSDEDQAALKTYAESHTDEQTEAYRKQLVNNTVCYPHVAGEDDKSHPMRVDEVFNEIRAEMLKYAGNPRLADAAFDDLIYKYNSDPGAFGNETGYSVKNDKDGNNYVEEFTAAALDMRKNYEVGEVYSDYVITDYGVHVMYLASVTRQGEVGLYDYTTPGENKTYYEVIEEALRSAKSSASYNTWAENVFSVNYKKQSVRYEDAYSDLWED
ncbi:MAG: hypothetical protein K2M48_05165 [Clostridiales bacterium]|nr:hypothetical protein [Clostridiales bacterium]